MQPQLSPTGRRLKHCALLAAQGVINEDTKGVLKNLVLKGDNRVDGICDISSAEQMKLLVEQLHGSPDQTVQDSTVINGCIDVMLQRLCSVKDSPLHEHAMNVSALGV